MVRKIVIVGIVLLVGGVIFWNDKRSSTPARPLTTNAPAPHFALTDISGHPLDSANFKGKVVLVDFWATWCVPCEAEIPHLVEWQHQHAADGLQVVGLSMDDTAGPVKPFVDKHKMDYPIAMSDDKTEAAFGGILGLPVNILIGRDGKILAKHSGVTDINALQAEVEHALAQH